MLPDDIVIASTSSPLPGINGNGGVRSGNEKSYVDINNRINVKGLEIVLQN